MTTITATQPISHGPFSSAGTCPPQFAKAQSSADTFELIQSPDTKSTPPLSTPQLITAVQSEKLSQSTPLLNGTPNSELNEYPLIQESLLNEQKLNLQSGNRSGFIRSEITPAKGIVLGLHGWSAGTWQFEHLGQQLAEQGYHVYVPRLPGHGVVDPQGVPTSKEFPVNHEMHRYTEFADRVYGEAASTGLPVHTIGLSGGGAIALDIAGRHEVASSMLYDPFLSPGDAIADSLMSVFKWLDLFTFGLASRLLRLLPVIFEGPKKDIEKWGRNGHVNFNAAQIFTLTHYGRQAVENARGASSPIQVIGTDFEPGVVSRELLEKVTSDGVNRGLYTFDESSEVPHAMIHWREFENDEARAQVRALTLDFLEKGNALTS
ncbi:MAG: alpha/beta fold hydrolase [Myxococcota bacterium]|nr:alpha/beta fold hydrolase [Myxococcota bacterium]